MKINKIELNLEYDNGKKELVIIPDEIKRLQSNCKTLAKMLDKEIENKRQLIDFIDRYLQVDLNEFDTKGLLEKIKEILERE